MKLIVLDRDGVINEEIGDTITEPGMWQPIPGSLEAIARLHQSGWRVAVACNQSGIARGVLDIAALTAIHCKMNEMVQRAGGRLDMVAFCPHADSDDCNCRKPAPGLLYTIGERFAMELPEVIMVGDSLRDVQAAMAAAAKPVLVRTGKGQDTLDNNKGLEHIPAYDDLATFVDELLADNSGAAEA